MTMYQGPYPTAGPGVPADLTGTYPALAGYTPMSTGRRMAVALGDVGIILLGYALAFVLVAVIGPRNVAATWAMGLVYVALLIGELWAMFAKSSRLSGVFMGAQYVDVVTGQPSGGKAFGKWLLTGLIGAISFDIAPVIMYFATIQEPLKRNWFDRTMGLMLVDTRTGRRPGDPLPAVPTLTPPPAVAAVQFPTPGSQAPGQAWTPQPPAGSYLPPVAPLAPYAGATAGPPPGLPAPSAVRPITDAGGLITSTPRSATAPTVPPVERPAAFAPPVVVREMRSVDAARAAEAAEAAEVDRTTLATDASLAASATPGAHLRMDDGSLIPLVPPTVIGRNPVAPGSHPDAVPRVVDDRLASKTHLLAGLDESGPWVIDLHSTNGVTVAKVPGAASARIEPGRKVHLPAGATVAFGERTMTAL